MSVVTDPRLSRAASSGDTHRLGPKARPRQFKAVPDIDGQGHKGPQEGVDPSGPLHILPW